MVMRSAMVGTRAPNFSLLCTEGPPSGARRVTLDDYLDRWLLLLFYSVVRWFIDRGPEGPAPARGPGAAPAGTTWDGPAGAAPGVDASRAVSGGADHHGIEEIHRTN